MNIQKIERAFEKAPQLVKNTPFATKEQQKNPWFRHFFKGKILYGLFEFIHEVYEKSQKYGKVTWRK